MKHNTDLPRANRASSRLATSFDQCVPLIGQTLGPIPVLVLYGFFARSVQRTKAAPQTLPGAVNVSEI